TLPGNGEKDSIDVAEVVDNDRLATDGRGQLRLDVMDLPTKFIPDLGNTMPVVAIPDDGFDNRTAARRFRFDPLQLAELLTGALDRVRDLERHIFRTGAGIRCDDQGFLDREFR